MDFIDRLKQFRKIHGLGQGEFARLANIPSSTVSNWENKTRGVPVERQKEIERFIAAYEENTQPKSPQKGSNRSTKVDTGSTVDSKLEADATRLGFAVVAVRRAEVKLEKLAPMYEAAKAEFEKARAELDEIEASLLSKIG